MIITRLYGKYLRLVTKRPKLVNLVTASVISGSGDVICQLLIERRTFQVSYFFFFETSEPYSIFNPSVVCPSCLYLCCHVHCSCSRRDYLWWENQRDFRLLFFLFIDLHFPGIRPDQNASILCGFRMLYGCHHHKVGTKLVNFMRDSTNFSPMCNDFQIIPQLFD